MDYIAGVDLGARRAGSTAIAFCKVGGHSVNILHTEKGQDADKFVYDRLTALVPKVIFMDAPLSLPGHYTGQSDDYFYRKCDRELKAMSPMFLGGLTARAMKLRDKLIRNGLDVKETYSAQQAKRLELSLLGYKKKKSDIPNVLDRILDVQQWKLLDRENLSWHAVDALLALIGAQRFQDNEHYTFGEKAEGRIFF